MPGDRYLLCTDGLVNEVRRRPDRRRCSRGTADPAGRPPTSWSQLANEAGGRDNITVVVVDVLDLGRPAWLAPTWCRPTTAGHARDRAARRLAPPTTWPTASTPTPTRRSAGPTGGPTAAAPSAAASVRHAQATPGDRAHHRRSPPRRGRARRRLRRHRRVTAVTATTSASTATRSPSSRAGPGGVLWFNPTLDGTSATLHARRPHAGVPAAASPTTRPSARRLAARRSTSSSWRTNPAARDRHDDHDDGRRRRPPSTASTAVASTPSVGDRRAVICAASAAPPSSASSSSPPSSRRAPTRWPRSGARRRSRPTSLPFLVDHARPAPRRPPRHPPPAPPAPTACCCRSPRCSTASATCSSPASTTDLAGLQADVDAHRHRRLRRSRCSSCAAPATWPATSGRSPSSASCCCCCRSCPASARLVNGSRIWVSVGPINFQPGEFAKIALALFFAAYLVEQRELLAMARGRSARSACPSPATSARCSSPGASSLVVLVGQKDLGSSLLFFTLFVVMLWVATERAELPRHRRACCSPAGAYARVAPVRPRAGPRRRSGSNPWRRARRQGLPDRPGARSPWPAAALTGTGLGLGDPTRIPEVKNDFIFAAIGEELGLLGATAIIIAFLLMIGAGLRIAIRAERPFEKLLATGLTTILGVQAFVIIGGVTRVRPADRRHPAVRQLRRLVAAGQLHAAGPAAAHLRLHRAAPRRGPRRTPAAAASRARADAPTPSPRPRRHRAGAEVARREQADPRGSASA